MNLAERCYTHHPIGRQLNAETCFLEGTVQGSASLAGGAGGSRPAAGAHLPRPVRGLSGEIPRRSAGHSQRPGTGTPACRGEGGVTRRFPKMGQPLPPLSSLFIHCFEPVAAVQCTSATDPKQPSNAHLYTLEHTIDLAGLISGAILTAVLHLYRRRHTLNSPRTMIENRRQIISAESIY